jgi:hypothetical protein
MKYSLIQFSKHAIQQMYFRSISKEEIKFVVENGEIIMEYPEDTPYPTKLMMGMVNQRIFHVVLSHIENENKCIIITAYEPDQMIWSDDYKTRRIT